MSIQRKRVRRIPGFPRVGKQRAEGEHQKPRVSGEHSSFYRSPQASDYVLFMAEVINFNLKATAIYRATWWGRRLIFRTARFFKFLFLILFLCSGVTFLLGILQLNLSDFILKNLLAGVIFFFVFFLFFLEVETFFKLKIKKPGLKIALSQALAQKDTYNLASFLDYDITQVFRRALKFQKQKTLPVLFPKVLLYFLLTSKNKEVDFLLARADIEKKKLIRALEQGFSRNEFDQEEGLEKAIIEAAQVAQRSKKTRLGVGDMVKGLAATCQFFQRVLMDVDMDEQDIERLKRWFERRAEEIKKRRRFWDYENLIRKGSLARDWAAGYSVILDRYSIDLRKRIKKQGFAKIVGHQKEISQVERILARDTLNNVLLVGEPGAGRRSIVLAVAQGAFLGKCLEPLNYKRFLELDIGALVNQTPSLEEVEQILEKCFQEAMEAGNIILVIDNLQNFIQDIPKPGTVDISGILARYVELPNFQLLAITTFEGLHRILERRPGLLNLFSKISVWEISEAETLEFLEDLVPFLEKRYKKFITFQALRDVVKLASLYLPNIPFPKKALDTLDEVMVYLTQGIGGDVLRPSHVARVIAEKTQIPVGKLEQKEREVLLSLETLVHQRVINQEEAVREVASALRRARTGVKTRTGPIGSFLFLGPTGVGKTETAKALAQFYFGSEKRMIRLDMSEFQNVEDIGRLLGSEQGQIGLLTSPVRERPFSLVLLDEIEKAHPNILNLFLQVLDEGSITDGLGRRTSFRQTMIIATSNAGAEIIRRDISQDKKMDLVRAGLLDELLKRNIFRPEFINRFDGVVVFKPLTRDNLLAIVQLMLNGLAKKLKEKGIELVPEEGLQERIVKLGYSPEFGAREIRRVLQDKVENLLATAILAGKIKKGDRVKVDRDFFLEILS